MISIKVKIEDGDELEIQHLSATCTEEDIAAICYAVKRHLREEFGRSPFSMEKR